jgi:hypothetical protein
MNQQKNSPQNEEVLRYMRQHGGITPVEALRKLGVFRLGARIFELKHQGYDIISTMVKSKGKRYSRYEFAK